MSGLQLLALAIPAVLLAATVAGTIPAVSRDAPRRAWTLLSVGCAVACAGAAMLLLVFLLPGLGGVTQVVLEGPGWLSFPGRAGFETHWGMHVDALAALLLFAATALAALITATLRESTGPRRGAGSLPAVMGLGLVAMTVLLSAADFAQLVFGWQLSAWCGFLLVSSYRTAGACLRAARRMLIVQLSGDVLLVLAVYLLWRNSGSLRFDVVLDLERVRLLVRHAPVALSGAGLCLLGAVLARCGQFPLLLWWGGLASVPAGVGIFVGVIIAILPGLYLLMRCLPLYAGAEVVTSLMLLFGCVTILVSATTAAAQEQPRRAVYYLLAGTMGWVLLGIGCADPRLHHTSAGMLLAHVPLLATLTLPDDRLSRRRNKSRFKTDENAGSRAASAGWSWQQVVTATVLASGLWGQGSILSAAWELAAPPAATAAEPVADIGKGGIDGSELAGTAGARARRVSVLIPMAATLGLLFSSMTFVKVGVRGVAKGVRNRTPNSAEATMAASGEGGVLTGLVLLSLLITALVETAAYSERGSPWISSWYRMPIAPQFFVAGIGVPAALLGGVLAWISRGSRENGRGRLENAFAPLVRYCRNLFYLDDVFEAVLARPLRLAAFFCTRVERLHTSVRRPNPEATFAGELSNRVRSLRIGQMQLSALAFLLSLGGMLCVLTWGGR